MSVYIVQLHHNKVTMQSTITQFYLTHPVSSQAQQWHSSVRPASPVHRRNSTVSSAHYHVTFSATLGCSKCPIPPPNWTHVCRFVSLPQARQFKQEPMSALSPSACMTFDTVWAATMESHFWIQQYNNEAQICNKSTEVRHRNNATTGSTDVHCFSQGIWRRRWTNFMGNKRQYHRADGWMIRLNQCFSTFVRPRPGKFFFQKTRARSQQIYL
jgi:hypothetical protein